MIKRFVFLIFILLFFSSCEFKNDKKIKISATTWIGYTPLFYAKEKNWLEPLNIKLLNVVSLSENMYLYKAGNADAYVGTQFEYNFLYKENKNLTPIIFFNKSNGGDVILSNLSIDKLIKTNKTIDAYLEIDSINSVVLNDFLKSYNLQDKNINYINEDQSIISRLNAKDMKNPTIITTYIPYNYILTKNSFKEVSTTKNNSDLLVIDAMYTTESFYYENKETFEKLKKLIDKAIINLQNNPEEFYKTVKPYFANTSYDEFLTSLNDIIWLNKDISNDVLIKLNNSDFKTKDIIK
jgi:NitT/TauT family transport system substrate-binding protein